MGPRALPQATAFPSGSYTFTVALTNVSTACTTSEAAFSCSPSTTYNATLSDPAVAAATFHWIIKPQSSGGGGGGGGNYSISSSANPFEPSFANATMTLVDGDQYSERYTFSFSRALPVVPATAVVPGQTRTATCTFPSTTWAVTVWTRLRAAYPAGAAALPTPTAASDTFAPWPYRVEMAEVQAAQPGVPACVDSEGQSLGDLSGRGQCGCWSYKYGLGGLSPGTSPRGMMAKRWKG